MARPQAADYHERRDAIADKAAELYGEFGFSGSSIMDLANACGMSKSLLYHYFSSKEDILFEIMDEHVTTLGRIVERLQNKPDPKQRLAALTHAFVATCLSGAHRHKVFLEDLNKLPPHRRKTIVAKQRVLLSTVEAILDEISPTLAKQPQARRAACMIYFGMVNSTHAWFDAKGALSVSDVAELTVGVFLRGVLANPTHHQ